jgi:hypothetical protein
MTEPQPAELTDNAIKAFLEKAPLYTWQVFGKPAQARTSLWIKGVDLFCQACDCLRPFHDMRSRGAGSGTGTAASMLKSGTSYFEYRCVTCRSEKQYLVQHEVGEDTVRLQKYGELPRPPLYRDRVMQKFLKDDRENYQKATACLANGYGIGAFAYLRRIVENNIGRLLDLVQKETDATGGDPAVAAALADLKKDTPMIERIKVANSALPPHLKPDGLNPLGRLYQVLSEGVHAFSDAECLAQAQTASRCLAYLVNELTSRQAAREDFKRGISEI